MNLETHRGQEPNRNLRNEQVIISPVAEISGDLGNVEAQIAEIQKTIQKRFGPGANIGLQGLAGQEQHRKSAEKDMAQLVARRDELKIVREAAMRGDTEALRSHYDQDIARGEHAVEDRARALGEGMETLRQERPQAIEAHMALESNIANIERLAQMDPQMEPGLEQAVGGLRRALENSEVSRLRRPLDEAQKVLDRKIEFRAAVDKQ